MSLDRIVNITINLAEPPIPLASFAIPLVLAVLTSPQVTAFGSDRTMEVTPSNWQSELSALGVGTSEDLYVCLSDLFAQDVQPDTVIIGRRLTAVAMVESVNVVGTGNGTYTVSINGNDYSFVASGSTATQIRDGLIAAIDAGAEPVDAAIGASDTLTVTADEAGVPFTLSVTAPSSGLTITHTTPNTGTPEDLTAIAAERNDWFWVLETTHSSGVIRAIAAAVEPLRKIFIAQANDADVQTSATDDIASDLAALEYENTSLWWHNDDDQFVDAALVGRIAPRQPGSANYANQPLSSVTGVVPTSTTYLLNKNANWLERFVAAGFAMTQNGVVSSGQWLDLKVVEYWMHNLVQIRIVELLRNNDVVPYTQEGADAVADTIRTALEEGASVGAVVQESIDVTVPTVSALTSQTRATRHLANVVANCTLRGGINTVDATINMGS